MTESGDDASPLDMSIGLALACGDVRVQNRGAFRVSGCRVIQLLFLWWACVEAFSLIAYRVLRWRRNKLRTLAWVAALFWGSGSLETSHA